MQLHETAILRRHGHRRTWLVGAAGAALLATVALGSWQGLARRDGARTTVGDPVVVQVAPTTVQPAVAVPGSSDMTVYLVGSQAEATRLLDVIAEGNRHLEQFGRPPFNAQVVVAVSADDGARSIAAHADVNAYRASMGLAPHALLDLRTR